MKRAFIWAGSPDVLDGIYVEIEEKFGKSWIGIESTWFHDIQACKDWLERKGVPSDNVELK